jgi:Methyltransferase FkbM domain
MNDHFVRRIGKKYFPAFWKWLAANRSAWRESISYAARAKLVNSCPDNARMQRVPDAGKVINGLQIMHNGIRVLDACYYGNGGKRILSENGGCHEPQEEVVFDAIVRSLPPGATMLELGAYWGFYSMWFAKDIPDARVFLVEPEASHLDIGKRHFELNGLHGDFTHAFIGAEDGVDSSGTAIRSVDSLTTEKNLTHLSVLHSDIQGFELDMLKGARQLIEQRRVDYLFVSTHSMELHYACADHLKTLGYSVIVSIDLEESYSFDGILVAHAPSITPPSFVHPSRRPQGVSLSS